MLQWWLPMQALALGADAVLVGRPILHGLAVDGQAGVEKVLNTLKAELKLNMALSGTDVLARMLVCIHHCAAALFG